MDSNGVEEITKQWEEVARECGSSLLNTNRPHAHRMMESLVEGAVHTSDHVANVANSNEAVVQFTLEELAVSRRACLENCDAAVEATKREQEWLCELEKWKRGGLSIGGQGVSKEEEEGGAVDMKSGMMADVLSSLQSTIRLAGQHIASSANNEISVEMAEKLEEYQTRTHQLEQEKLAAVAELDVTAQRLALRSSPEAERESMAAVCAAQQSSEVRESVGFAAEEPSPLWKVVCESAEEAAIAQVTEVEMKMAEKEEEVNAMKLTVSDIAEENMRLSKDAQKLSFVNGILMHQLASLYHKHREPLDESISTKLRVLKRADLSVYGDCVLPPTANLTGKGKGLPTLSSTQEIDVSHFTVDSFAEVVQRMTEMEAALFELSQSVKSSDQDSHHRHGGESRESSEGAGAARSSSTFMVPARMTITASGALKERHDKMARLSSIHGTAHAGDKRKRGRDSAHVGEAHPRPSHQQQFYDPHPCREKEVDCRDASTMPDPLLLLEDSANVAESPLTCVSLPPKTGPSSRQTLAAVSEQIISANRLAITALEGQRFLQDPSEVAVANTAADIHLREALLRTNALVEKQEGLIASLEQQLAKKSCLVGECELLLAGLKVTEPFAGLASQLDSASRVVQSAIQEAASLRDGDSDPLLAKMKNQQRQHDHQWNQLAQLLQDALSKEHQLCALLASRTGNYDADKSGSTLEELRAMFERGQKELRQLQQHRDEDKMKNIQFMEQLWQLEESCTQLKDENQRLLADIDVNFVPLKTHQTLLGNFNQSQQAAANAESKYNELYVQFRRTEEDMKNHIKQHTAEIESNEEAIGNLQAALQNKETKIAEALQKVAVVEGELKNAQYDLTIVEQRVEERQKMIDAKDKQNHDLQHTIVRLESKFLTREETRELFQERFPNDESVLRFADMVGELSSENCQLTSQLAAAETETEKLQQETETLRRKVLSEQQQRQQLELELLQRDREAKNEQSKDFALKMSVLESQNLQLETERNMLLEREAVLQRQVNILKSDPISSNVKRFGLSNTENLQEQLEEVHDLKSAIQEELRAANQSIDVLREKLIAQEDAIASLENNLTETKKELALANVAATNANQEAQMVSEKLSSVEKDLNQSRTECGGLKTEVDDAKQLLGAAEKENGNLREETDALKQKQATLLSLAEKQSEKVNQLKIDLESSLTDCAELQKQLESKTSDRTRLVQDNLLLQQQTKQLETLVDELRAAAANATAAARGNNNGRGGAQRSGHRVAAGRSLTSGLQ